MFEAIVPILAPLGVPLDAIVRTCEFGVEWGGDADRYERRIVYFRGLTSSENATLAGLGEAALILYEPAHREALAAAEHARITRQA